MSTTTCGRDEGYLPPGWCGQCGAKTDEPCPLIDLTPGLLTSAPITAGEASTCNPDDGVCEACQ
jgi:hypothetical protein